MSEFSQLLNDLDNFARTRGVARARPAAAPRPIPSTWGDQAARRADRANFAKALNETPAAAQAAAQTARQIQAEGQGLRLENIRQRARVLVETTRRELLKAVKAGKLTAVEATKSEAFLNNFVVKMGI